MDGHDAFGRETDEDPLKEMGWSGEAATVPPPPPAEAVETKIGAAEPDTPAPPTTPHAPPSSTPTLTSGSPLPGWTSTSSPTPPPARVPTLVVSSSRGPRIARFVIVLALFGAIAGGALVFIGSVKDTVDGFTVPSFPGDDDSSGPGKDKPSTPPEGFAKGSLLLRGNLSPALRELRKETGGGRLRFLRVDAQSVQVQVVSGGQLMNAIKRWDGAADVISKSPASSGPATFSWAQVNASAPRRIATEVSRRTGRAPSAFGYAVLIDAAGLHWSAFTKSGKAFQAKPDGRITRSL
jgi:hypothetical protein